MYISCSQEPATSQNGCSNIFIETLDDDEVAFHFEQMLNFARTIDNQEDYTTMGEFHQTVFGTGEQATNYVRTFEKEGSKYAQLGFENYVQQSDNFSVGVKSYLTNYSVNLRSYLNDQKPSLEELNNYIDRQKDLLKSKDLCNDDINLLNLYFSISQGYANWYYSHYYDNTENALALRSCDFWEAIACRLLSHIVATTVGSVLGSLLLLSEFTVTDGNGNTAPIDREDQNAFSVIVALAVGIYVGISVYDWCCKRNEIPEQVCEDPEGVIITQNDCNEFIYRVWGPSSYNATEWNNMNTNPSSINTPTPKLTFSVPSLGDESMMSARITCVGSGSAVSFYAHNNDITFESDTDYFPLEWATSPPNVFILSSDFSFANLITANVNIPTSDAITYSWSVNSPHTIVSGGTANDNFVNIQVNNANIDLVTSVTATNNCSNETESISATTLIQ